MAKNESIRCRKVAECFLKNKEKRTKMKRIVGILALILAFSAVLSVMVGCNNDDIDDGKKEEPVYTDYTVTVIDGLNNPVSNVIVNFAKDGSETKMRVTDKDGIASYKNAVAGDYTVTIEQGYSDAVILQSEYKLTKETTSLRVIVRDATNTLDIYGDIPENSFAYSVDEGSHNVVCSVGSSSYVVFNALQTGIYKVSLTSDDGGMTIGHYGIPMFVQSTHCGDLDYDGKSFELVIKDRTTPYVLGINATADSVATVTIERIGNAPFDPIYDAEWVEVQSTATLEKCNLDGKTLVDFDIESTTLTVSLGEDGYYYTNDGKLVYIRITSQTGHGHFEDQQFIPVLGGSLALLAGHVDSNVGVNVGGYIYDENGNFVNKLRYNEMIKTYMDYTDPTYGVVPLTAELAECIKLHGESKGWWDANGGAYLFESVNVNAENVWLFLCMVEQ